MCTYKHVQKATVKFNKVDESYFCRAFKRHQVRCKAVHLCVRMFIIAHRRSRRSDWKIEKSSDLPFLGKLEDIYKKFFHRNIWLTVKLKTAAEDLIGQIEIMRNCTEVTQAVKTPVSQTVRLMLFISVFHSLLKWTIAVILTFAEVQLLRNSMSFLLLNLLSQDICEVVLKWKALPVTLNPKTADVKK